MSQGNMVRITVYRFDPAKDEQPNYEIHQVPSGPGVMVLDALNYIRENYDPTLRFRHSCHMGKCGSCTVMVNGWPALACWQPIKDGIVIEPLRGFPVVADLVIDRTKDDLVSDGLIFERKHPVQRGQPQRIRVPNQKLLDEVHTCIGCDSCVSACPYIYAEDRIFIGPKQMVEIARHAYDPRVDENHVLGIAVGHGVWDCTACTACLDACPQQIDARQRIQDLRAMIIERPALQGLPRQIKRVNESLYTYHNPYRYIKTDRGKWAIGLDIKNVARGDRAEWLYFAGCTADYEPRDEAVARGLAAVFRQAGLDVGILGVEEICCGDPARFTGEQGLHEYIRDQNKELLDKYGVSRVVTTCPHGYTNFKQEWEGTSRTVEHYARLLYQLVKQGKLTFSRELDLTVTYHDSCYLGRYHGIYEEPRELLCSIPGIKLVEMKDNRNQSLCCGGGGGAAFLDVKAKPRLAWIRVRQAQDAGAGVIAVACPFCRSLLGDAVKDLESNIKVLQISELVSQAL